MLGKYAAAVEQAEVVALVTQMVEAHYQIQHAQYAGMYTWLQHFSVLACAVLTGSTVSCCLQLLVRSIHVCASR
jgi:hypothetical protein